MKNRASIITILVISILLASCDTAPSITPTSAPATQEPVVVTETQVPTATTLPMAVIVNGEGILLSEYEDELLRLQDALVELEMDMTPEDQQTRVLDGFIDELLLSQAAVAAGHVISDEDVQSHIDQLVADLGSTESLVEWQTLNHYTDESIRTALKRQLSAAWQRDTIVEAVPETAEQIHARQLFYKNEANAIVALNQLSEGVDFTMLAKQQDPTLGGDLGWFPRGMLTQPEVEEAVFALQSGETTGIIASSLGFHIVNVMERDVAHQLSTEARLMLQKAALQKWLSDARATSTIEILVP